MRDLSITEISLIGAGDLSNLEKIETSMLAGSFTGALVAFVAHRAEFIFSFSVPIFAALGTGLITGGILGLAVGATWCCYVSTD